MNYYASLDGIGAIALGRISSRIQGRVPAGYDWWQLQRQIRAHAVPAERKLTPAFEIVPPIVLVYSGAMHHLAFKLDRLWCARWHFKQNLNGPSFHREACAFDRAVTIDWASMRDYCS